MTEELTALELADELDRVAKWSDSEHWGTLNEAAAKLRHLHEEVTEQGRLLSMSAERELALLARIGRQKKALRLALEALEWNLPVIEDWGGEVALNVQHKAIAAIRARGETK